MQMGLEITEANSKKPRKCYNTGFQDGVVVGAKGMATVVRNKLTAGESPRQVHKFCSDVIHNGDKRPQLN